MIRAPYAPIRDHTECRRCTKGFFYARTTKRRVYCPSCVELERQDANDFFNGKAREARQQARQTAWLCHVEAEILA